MGRQRTVEIRESLSRLYELERGMAGSPAAARVKMLRLMKENPRQTIAQIAETIGQGCSTVERWWGAYRRDGLDGLMKIGTRGGNRSPRADLQQVGSLTERIEQGELTSYEDIRQWLEEEFGAVYSTEGVRTLVKSKVGGIREARREARKNRSGAERSGVMSDRFMRFLNTLPIAGDIGPWVREFQRMLPELFPDIDKVLVVVNVESRFMGVEAMQVEPIKVVVSQHALRNGSRKRVVQVEPGREIVENQQAERILRSMREKKFPLHQYHSPHSFEYFYHGEYVGLFILFREIHRSPISQGTLEAIGSLQPFFTFLLAHLVMRKRFFTPTDSFFYSSLNDLLRETDLSNQQLRIVTHLLLGRSYKEIADLLSIAEGTVKKQINTIYQKTGMRSHNELFAKYFALRLEEQPVV